MATLTKYNLQGEEIGQVDVDDAFFAFEANGQMIKDYIIALRENARQWSASTKTRAEVEHTTKKPHAQKGTGNARQGTLVAPQHRGGGRAHGPRPKFNQHVRINKKERRAAIRSLLAEKMRAGRMLIVEDMRLDAPKTQTVSRFLKPVDVCVLCSFSETMQSSPMKVEPIFVKVHAISKRFLFFPQRSSVATTSRRS